MAPPITGWQDYFGIRLEDASQNSDGKTVLEPPMLDGKQQHRHDQCIAALSHPRTAQAKAKAAYQ
eukprot:scaffold147346_cov31-Prasinocladus_malaysianus.AAC.1